MATAGRLIKSGFQYLTDKDYRFLFNVGLGMYNSVPDEEFLKRKYQASLHRELNLDNPQTFNEKIQWLKLHDHRPEYTMMVDKYKVREYIAEKLGEEYLIPLLGVWDDPDEIEFDKLPDQFVLKCNHNSGLGMCICKDKSKLNIKKVKAGLRKGLKEDYYLTGREWPYKNVPRKIIAEKYMVNESENRVSITDAAEQTKSSISSDGLLDYKLMCFNGEVRCSFVCSDRFNGKGLKVTFFDNDWNVLPFERHYPKSDMPIAKPKKFEKMVQFAEQLSINIPFVRVDFYEINGDLYFGELTFSPGSGMEEFTPESADYELGSWIKLPPIIGGGVLDRNT